MTCHVYYTGSRGEEEGERERESESERERERERIYLNKCDDFTELILLHPVASELLIYYSRTDILQHPRKI